MTDSLNSLLLTELFVPNCKVMISGKHCFFDRNIYANPYGIAFFNSPDDFSDNPYIAPIYAGMPGILDEYFDDGIPQASQKHLNCEMREKITENIPSRFLLKKDPDKKNSLRSFECCYDGCISVDASGSVVLKYGTVMPDVICITGSVISASFPFSPISCVTFTKGKRTMQSVDYPVSHGPFLPPEDISIDFATTATKLEANLDCDLYGTVELEYTIDVGAAKCEKSYLKIQISQAD